jgi:DNA polymerase-3 subunit epsilon
VLDLETTGTDPGWDEITEVGAVAVRGGERLGTFHTLVGGGHPGIDAVLPSLLEFVRHTVITGHNIQFDLRFLNAALGRSGRPLLGTDHVVDTMPLARRLVRDDVDDCRLGTLAQRFELDHRPSHRAFEDAAATVDLLHLLIERSSAYGVVTLDDLRTLPPLAGHRWATKLRCTAALPRTPGVLLCHGPADEVLLVRASDDVRRTARQLFDGSDARRLAPVLRDLRRCSVHPVVSPLAGRVAELRLVRTVGPTWQRRELAAHRAQHVLVSPTGRATVGRVPKPGWRCLGPMPDRATALAAAAGVAAGGASSGAPEPLDAVAAALDRRHAMALADLHHRHERLEAVRTFTGTIDDDGVDLAVVGGLLDHPSLPVDEGTSAIDRLDEHLAVAAAIEHAGRRSVLVASAP